MNGMGRLKHSRELKFGDESARARFLHLKLVNQHCGSPVNEKVTKPLGWTQVQNYQLYG